MHSSFVLTRPNYLIGCRFEMAYSINYWHPFWPRPLWSLMEDGKHLRKPEAQIRCVRFSSCSSCVLNFFFLRVRCLQFVIALVISNTLFLLLWDGTRLFPLTVFGTVVVRGPPAGHGGSCRPGDGGAVLLGLHAQGGDTGRLAVGVHVEVVAVDAAAHPGTPEQAAHVRLPHVAPGTRHAQEVRHPAGMGVRGHAGGDGVAGHHAAWHRRCPTAAPYPRGVLDLEHSSTGRDTVSFHATKKPLTQALLVISY